MLRRINNKRKTSPEEQNTDSEMRLDTGVASLGAGGLSGERMPVVTQRRSPSPGDTLAYPERIDMTFHLEEKRMQGRKYSMPRGREKIIKHGPPVGKCQ